MATNFTVILFQRQHFGNEPGVFNDIEPNVPFAGSAKDFAFDCPGINPSETAFLIFQSRDVEHRRNIFQINGVDVFGGLPASPARDAWNGNILLIEPHHPRLRTARRVESAPSPMKKDPDHNSTDSAEIEALITRLERGQLRDEDAQLLARLLRLLLRLITLLRQKNASLSRLKRLLFGPRSDTRMNTNPSSSSGAERESHSASSTST